MYLVVSRKFRTSKSLNIPTVYISDENPLLKNSRRTLRILNAPQKSLPLYLTFLPRTHARYLAAIDRFSAFQPVILISYSSTLYCLTHTKLHLR